MSQEDLANALGLTVPKKDAHLFSKVKTAVKPPKSGWGTQIQVEKYNPNKVFPKLSIPLSMKIFGIKDIKNLKNLSELLESIQANNGDAIICFDYGKLWDYKPK